MSLLDAKCGEVRVRRTEIGDKVLKMSYLEITRRMSGVPRVFVPEFSALVWPHQSAWEGRLQVGRELLRKSSRGGGIGLGLESAPLRVLLLSRRIRMG